MKARALVIAALLLAGCSGNGEVIPTPSPGPDSPATTTQLTTTVLVAPATTEPEPVPTTEPVPVPTVPRRSTSTTEYLRVQATTPPRSNSATLASIRACESGGDYTAVSPNGLYYGAYQFALSTWRSVGGSGNPAHASPAEQDYRAQLMLDAGRRGEWPNC